jgi:hypothetical protein
MEERPDDSSIAPAQEPAAPVQRKWGSRDDSIDSELQLKPQVRKWGSRDDSIETEPAFKPPRRKWGSRDDEGDFTNHSSTGESTRRWGSIEEEDTSVQKTAQPRRWGSIEEEPTTATTSRGSLPPQTSNRFVKPSKSTAGSEANLRRPSNEQAEEDDVDDQLRASIQASVDEKRQQDQTKLMRDNAPRRGLDQQTMLIALGLALCVAAVLYQVLFL